MDHFPASTRGAPSGPAPRLSVGGQFIEALARRDFAALADCLDPSVRLRALLPLGPVELTGREEVAGWFRSLFGGPGSFEVADATVGEAGPRLYLRWRVSFRAPGPSSSLRLVEQHVFADGEERIGAVDLLCSGFVTQPGTVIGEQGRAQCQERQ